MTNLLCNAKKYRVGQFNKRKQRMENHHHQVVFINTGFMGDVVSEEGCNRTHEFIICDVFCMFPCYPIDSTEKYK